MENKPASLAQNEVLTKIFYAGCKKNFIGSGLSKLSEAKIRKTDISNWTQEVSDTICNSPLQVAVTYFLGICRIHNKAVTLLEEDVVQFYTRMQSSPCSAEINRSKFKKSRNEKAVEGRELDAESIISLELCEEFNIISLFEQEHRSDIHLLPEFNIPEPCCDLPDFGDELHLQSSLLDKHIKEIRSGPAGLAVSSQELDAIEIEGNLTQSNGERVTFADNSSATNTPKRKSHTTHDDTPTKRQRKSLVNADVSERRSSASRRLFDRDELRTSMPAKETMLADADEARPYEEQLYIPYQETEVETRQDSNMISSQVGQDLELDRESGRPVIDPSENVQNHHASELIENVHDLQLEELSDESLSHTISQRRRRSKMMVFLDEKKQIDIRDNLNNTKLCTRARGSTLVDLNKRLFENLFALPATGSKLRGLCSWGRTLYNLYRKRACPILDDIEVRRASSLPRDIDVDKRSRFSTFGRSPIQSISIPSTSVEQNVTSEAPDSNVDHDRELMPPPGRPMLSRPSDEQTSPRTPTRLNLRPPSLPASPQQQSPRTPIRINIEPDISAVISPRQSRFSFNITEPATADEPIAHARLPDDPDIGASSDLNPSFHETAIVTTARMSPRSTASDRESSTLMNELEFYRLLEDLWVKRFYEIDLDDIIIPEQTTLTMFFRYFNYLQRFQIQKKLTMHQEIIYGPVHVVKEVE